MNVVEKTKQYVADDRSRLRLYDTVSEEVRRVITLLADDSFSVQARWSEDEFRRRVSAFDELLADLCRVQALLGRWADDTKSEALTLALKRLCDPFEDGNGNTGWLAVRWYPVLLLFYAASVAAVAAGRYDALRALMHARVYQDGRDEPLVVAATRGLNDTTKLFGLLPGLERSYVPRSEHIHGRLRPLLEEVLFLGADYEWAFDRFEVLYAVEYFHLASRWPPIGRFGWKATYAESSPLHRALAEAEGAASQWAPLRAGLCAGSIDKFKATVSKLFESMARSGMVG